ncbi:MAG: SsrA-binding protein SmpB [Candidatus Eiseniibacteriota bacterium]|nr:MAG: SsrA-binding protein SmpB [Candidatus Eisenbacteria bacterium]
MSSEPTLKRVCTNRKARFLYSILETIEAGMALLGSEVKSLRAGKANIRDSYATVERNEVFLHNMHIGAYEQAGRFGHEPLRVRKLLLNRREIRRLTGRVNERGLTLVPLSVYFKGGHAKVELALVRGKKQYDRREDIARREHQREMERALKLERRGSKRR